MDIDNLEQLQNNWQKLSGKTNRADEHLAMLERLRKKRTAGLLERISRRHMRLGILGTVGLPLLAIMLEDMGVKPWFAVVYGLFGLLMGVLNIAVSHRLRFADYVDMPIVEAVRRIAQIKRWLLRLQVLGWALCIPIVAELSYEFWKLTGPAGLWGAICGAVVGGVIGIRLEIKSNRQVKELLAEFESSPEDENTATI